MLDGQRLRDLWQRVCDRSEPAVPFARLMQAHAEPHRAYHNAAHIADCLEQFDHVQAEADRPDEVEAALWFHDVVYDPRAADNEERSAAWAAQVLHEGGASPDVVQRIAALIRATQHDQEPDSIDCKLLLDVDLSILGRDAEAFAAYDRSIRAEFHWVPEATYRAGRARILESFLRRPAIYHTAYFREKYETQARLNLERTIAGLRE